MIEGAFWQVHNLRFVVSNPSSTLLATHASCLPVGTVITDFEIIGLVGEGGFGIVYLARDTSLDRVVALKEFMPAAFAGRVDGVRVAVRTEAHVGTYQAGLRSFINEAKMLAKFSHPALVEVYRFWEGNGTAYMAMRYYAGETLRQRLLRGEHTFDEESIAQIMAPIFDTLEMLHREQVFHRDIAPDNIMLSDGRPVLLDFGSARRIIGDGTQALTTILKPGYAPVEQYVDDGTMKQGPWTDVYALGGVLYHLATGKAPLQAISRLLSDPLQTVNEVTHNAFSLTFSNAVAKAMAVRVEDRLQTVREFSELLGWNIAQSTRVVTLPSAPLAQTELTGSESPGREVAPAAAPDEIFGGTQQPVYPPEAKVGLAGLRVGAAVVGVIVLAAAAVYGYLQTSASPTGAPAPKPPVSADVAAVRETPTRALPQVQKAPTIMSAPVVAAGTGMLNLDVKPWGTVVIDGVTRGISSPDRLRQIELPVGSHKIEIAKPGATPLAQTIEVSADAPLTISHMFK